MLTQNTALLRVCSLLLLVAGSRQLMITEFSVPPYIESGGSATLRCMYQLAHNESEDVLYVKWWWTPHSSSSDDRKLIYQRIAGHPAAFVPHANASKIDIKADDSIVLTEVTPVDSGTYECEVSNIDEWRRHDRLVVYQKGTGPSLNVSELLNSTENNKSVNLMVIECLAEDVAPKPEMSVSIDGKDIVTDTEIDDDDHDGVYTIFANATLNAEDMGEVEVRCELFFADANITHPPYVDIQTFVPTGYDTQSTTEVPEDATDPDATPESLKTPSDSSIQVICSWNLLVFATILSIYKQCCRSYL